MILNKSALSAVPISQKIGTKEIPEIQSIHELLFKSQFIALPSNLISNPRYKSTSYLLFWTL